MSAEFESLHPRSVGGRFSHKSLVESGTDVELFATTTLDGTYGLAYEVTPGVLDDAAIAAYQRGQCLALAQAIAADLPGAGVFAVVPADEVENIGVPGTDWQLYLVHAVAREPDGTCLDITGVRTEQQLLADYAREVGEDCGDLTLVELSDEDQVAWENHDETPDLNHVAAATFVGPVIGIASEGR